MAGEPWAREYFEGDVGSAARFSEARPAAKKAGGGLRINLKRLPVPLVLAAGGWRALAVAAGVASGAHETLREAVRAAELSGEGGGDAPPAGTEGADAMAWRCGRSHVDTLVRAYFRIRHGAA